MIQFTINSFSHGLTGRPYNSIKDAIQDGGSYSVWCNEAIALHLTKKRQTILGNAWNYT